MRSILTRSISGFINYIISLRSVLEKGCIASCKVVIYKYVFFGFYSVPNLIVSLFNFLYPVFIVGFDCKGCVIERECEDSSN